MTVSMNLGLNTNPWLAWHKPNLKARLRLFCFPYGGGGAGTFRTWQDGLPSAIEVCPVQICGREGRLGEAPYTRLVPLVEAIAEGLSGMLAKPFAFFGHSMGAMLAFELSRRLGKEQLTRPVHLFVSGRRAPQLPDPLPTIHHLDPDEFIAVLRQRNILRKEVLESAALIDYVTPILKADYEIVETYSYRPGDPFDFPITVFGGTEDPDSNESDLAAWKEQTNSSFALNMLIGDHFFIDSCKNSLLQMIVKHLSIS